MKTLKVFYYNVGSCNGCDIEALDGLLLSDDAATFEIVEHPFDADIVIFIGILTRRIFPYFKKILAKLKPKAIKIAFGSCAISGNVFFESPTFAGPVDKHTDIDLYINGCPPKADVAVKGLLAKKGLYPKSKLPKTEGEYWRGELKFYPEKCIGCLTCVYNCPARTINISQDKKGFKLTYDFERCFFCSACQRNCPTGAIVLTHKSAMIEEDKRKFKTEGRIKKGKTQA